MRLTAARRSKAAPPHRHPQMREPKAIVFGDPARESSKTQKTIEGLRRILFSFACCRRTLVPRTPSQARSFEDDGNKGLGRL
jgi:hypothetical protein